MGNPADREWGESVRASVREKYVCAKYLARVPSTLDLVISFK